MKTKTILIILSILMLLIVIERGLGRAEVVTAEDAKKPAKTVEEEMVTAEDAEDVDLETVVETTESGEEVEIEKVDYVLPWPGILPNHPFYFLKVFRDRVWGFLVRDPSKKAEWALLMADKRVWAGKMLVEKDKEALGVTTLVEAERYLEQALVKAEEAESQGKNIDDFLKRLTVAAQKHEEVLREMLTVVSEESQGVIEAALEIPKKILEKVREGE